MFDLLLFVLISGTVLIALGVDVGIILAWVRRRS
jgi:hypothetical protein